jgi:1-hydroxycarotenoid 3,4-desaturase
MLAPCAGFPLVRHNVFFSSAYASEFDDIFTRGRLPVTPTVYVCAQDRKDLADLPASEPERLLCLVNAPPNGDRTAIDDAELAACEDAAFGLMERCGLHIRRGAAHTVVTTPQKFDALFPATGGALYGQASHGWRASFSRPGARTRIPGLYLAGGSTHPGPGVPMAALSGRIAANAVMNDLQRRGRRVRA